MGKCLPRWALFQYDYTDATNEVMAAVSGATGSMCHDGISCE